MKILIVNQHSLNHGDEAAGMALVRNLAPYCEKITIQYEMNETDEQCFIHHSQVENIIPRRVSGEHHLLKFCLRHPNFFTRLLLQCLPNKRAERRAIKSADVVISAPGGADLGIYQNHNYLWHLLEAAFLKKRLLFFSSSIGDISGKDYFSSSARKALTYAHFVSLRDSQSCRYAAKAGIPYVSAIDTAFSDEPHAAIPPELSSLSQKKYVVIVPNQLYDWHPFFQKYPPEQFNRFYIDLINVFLQQNVEVVLLPQLFCQHHHDDEPYFHKLKSECRGAHVISSKYNSDIQQKIIENAVFLVGARYHSIVFAINQKTPFACLSYEHKMKNMLEILNLSDLCFDMENALDTSGTVIEKILDIFQRRNEYINAVDKANSQARKIAKTTFETLLDHINR